MSKHSAIVRVDDRETVVKSRVLDGKAVLSAVGGDPARRDALIRIDGGIARLIPPNELIDVAPGEVPAFRVHRDGGLFHLKVDGRIWEWGSPAIRESDIREILCLPDDRSLFLSSAGGDAIRRGGMIDLTGDWVPAIVSGEMPPEQVTVPVVVNGRTQQLLTREVSFEDVVSMAFPQASDLTKGMFTVTFRGGPAERPEGSLVPSQTIKSTRGTVIHVTATDKS